MNYPLAPTPLGPQPIQLPVSWIENQLPPTLLRVLERRWLENMSADGSNFTYAGGERAESSFFRIHQVRHGPERFVSLHPNNMLNVLSSLNGSGYSLVYGLSAERDSLSLRMGLRRFGASGGGLAAARYVSILQSALLSNFPGIEMSLDPEGYEDVREPWLLPLARGRHRSCLTGIPSFKADATAFFTQSVDRLVDALRGESYYLLILAEPIEDVTTIQDRARRLSEEIHAQVKRNLSESHNRAETRGETSGSATSISAGLGGVLGALIGFQMARTHTSAIMNQDTDSTGLAVSYERLDKTAQYCETMLDAFQARLQRGRTLGFWNVGVFLASNDESTFLRANGILRGLYAGHSSDAEPLRVVNLTEARPAVGDALMALRLPRLTFEDEANYPHPLSQEFHGLGTPLATDELAIMMSLPHREVPGLKLRPTADFSLNPTSVDGFALGTLVYRGTDLKTPVCVSAQELTRHAFVTGLTGSGKTNTCLALLSAARAGQEKVNFLVIDPAKTEYRFLYYADEVKDDLLIFTLGETLAPFQLNPFEFDRRFPLLGHIDLVKAVFNAAFPMYASMPYLLEEAILAIYEERGWDVAESTNKYVKVADPAVDLGPYLPRLSDLHDKVEAIVSSKRYGAQLTQDLSAALKARLSSLLNGTKGLMLNTARGTSIDILLERPVVLELRGVPDEDEKAFVMALLFIRLYEACRARGMSRELRHITLIEEAHRLLRHAPPAASAESANPRGKAVEMFADMMAEMRVYGEGFIVVDQMPGKLIPDALKGSNLKIVHRLLALDDRAAVGNAMNLTLGQIEELPRLRQGQAVVHSEGLGEACLACISPCIDGLSEKQEGQTPEQKAQATQQLVGERMATFFAEQRASRPANDCTIGLRHLPAEAPAMAERFLSAVLLDADAGPAWWEIQALLDSQASRTTPERAQGARDVLAEAAIRRFRAAHGAPQRWDVQLALQTELMWLWANRLDGQPDDPALLAPLRGRLQSLRRGLQRDVAFAPAERRPGCTACPMRCYFGHRLQPINNPDVAPLLSPLRATDLSRPPNLAQLRHVADRQFSFVLSPHQQRVAAYCLLTQATNDVQLLAQVRRLIDAPREETV